MDVFLSFVSRVFSICHEWKVVISSRCFGLVNIDIFIGGDRDLINRRLGDREKICLCFFLFLLVWKGSPNRCLMSLACQIHLVLSRTFNFLLTQPPPAPSTFQILQSFDTHFSMLTSRKLFTCTAACVTCRFTDCLKYNRGKKAAHTYVLADNILH